MYSVHLLFIDFTHIYSYTIEHVSELPLLTTEPRFYVFHGIVCGVSTMEKYTYSIATVAISKHLLACSLILSFFLCCFVHSQHACFSCPNQSCGRGDKEENKYIRLHVAGASEATTISGGQFNCYCCGTQLVEDISLRTLASKLNKGSAYTDAITDTTT